MKLRQDISEFNRDLDALLTGEPAPIRRGEQAERLAIAEKLTGLDFSHLSTRQESTRRLLQTRTPVSPTRTIMNQPRFPVLRTIGYAGALIAAVFLLNWLLSSSLQRPPEPAGAETSAPVEPTPIVTPTVTPPAPTPTATAEAFPDPSTYVVKEGDTCVRIAFTFGISVESLIQSNDMGAQCLIFVGQKLQIPAGTEPPVPEALPLTAASGDEAIRRGLRESRFHWQTLFVDALVSIEAKGTVYVEREQAWLDRAGQSRWLSGADGAAPSMLRVQSGLRTVWISAEGDRQEYDSFDPEIGSLRALVFPQALAGWDGQFEAVREEMLAGRTALVVEWSTDEGRVEDRFWLDALTGLILKWERLFPAPADSAGRTDPVVIEVVLIKFDLDLPEGLFLPDQPVPLEFFEPATGLP